MAAIPRSIHRTWRTTEVPPQWTAAAASWRFHHPEWGYRLWTDSDARALVAAHRPRLLAIYDAYPYSIQRADAFRYVVLYALGGVYADLDLECLRSIEPLLGEHQLVLAREPYEHLQDGKRGFAGNAFLASRPGHPLLARVLECLESQRSATLTHLDVLHTTGPLMLDSVLERYRGTDVTVVDSETVYPLSQPQHARELDLLCRNAPEAPDLRRRLVAQGVFAVHYWSNSWVGALAGELCNPAPHSVPGYRFFPTWDCPGADLENAGRDVRRLARRCDERTDAVGFNTDGFIKSTAILRRRWQRSERLAWNEGLYVKIDRCGPWRTFLSALLRMRYPAFVILLLFAGFGCERDGGLQTVVRVEQQRVVVRYSDGKVRKVLNDFGYELSPGQEVKVVENCDGRLHVAVAYGP